MDMGLNQKQYIIKGMTHRMGLHLVIYQFRLHSVCKLTPIPKKTTKKTSQPLQVTEQTQ